MQAPSTRLRTLVLALLGLGLAGSGAAEIGRAHV